VKRFAPAWLDAISLRFNWIDDPANSHLRVTYGFAGSWSVIGTTCKNIPKDRATMNFGWLTPGVSDDEARRVILHEFGHALGLVHEHQRMDPTKWNKPVVIADLSGPPNNWDAATIESNMFDTFPDNAILGTQLDTTSIMMYPVAASWRLDSLSAGLNTDLSPLDRQLIRKAYT
jgi:serralysin